MADPEIIPCPFGVWTKVATAVQSGVIHLQEGVEQKWYQTYRETGGSAPSDLTEIIPFGIDSESRLTEEINANTPIDVYIRPSKKDGLVRVDL